MATSVSTVSNVKGRSSSNPLRKVGSASPPGMTSRGLFLGLYNFSGVVERSVPRGSSPRNLQLRSSHVESPLVIPGRKSLSRRGWVSQEETP